LTKITQEDLDTLLELFDRSEWRELHVKGEGIDLFASKDPNARRPEAAAGAAAPIGARPAVDTPPDVAHATLGARVPRGTDAVAPRPSHWVAVRAPCLGTFYCSPKPGAPPFVSVGQHVTPDTEVCIVEVMKLFTTVRAGVAGTIRELAVADSELVEFDQPLFLVEPDA
jgi:acetyl-CoA carboxylase biotin carboxyl carrier protein